MHFSLWLYCIVQVVLVVLMLLLCLISVTFFSKSSRLHCIINYLIIFLVNVYLTHLLAYYDVCGLVTCVYCSYHWQLKQTVWKVSFVMCMSLWITAVFEMIFDNIMIYLINDIVQTFSRESCLMRLSPITLLVVLTLKCLYFIGLALLFSLSIFTFVIYLF